MKKLRRIVLLASLPAVLLLGSCASQTKLDTLQGDISALQTQVEAASRDSAEALQTANATQADVDAMKASVEATRADAAASRRLLDEMNTRMDRTFGTEGYK